MSQSINIKTQMCLAVIPFLGWFIVIMTAVFNIKRAKSLGFGLLYGFCCIIPLGIMWGLLTLIIIYWIHPIGTYWKVITISTVLAYIVLCGLAFLSILIENAFLSKLCRGKND